jgi:hypothetical protein
MAITIDSIAPNPTIQATHLTPKAAQALSGLPTAPIVIEDFTDVTIFTGVVLCVFKGGEAGITRESLAFLIRDPNTQPADLRLDISGFHRAGGTVSLASFAYDGPVTDALWAVDRTTVQLVNLDRGTGTANLQVAADLAVRGLNGIVLRVNYTIFVRTRSGAIPIIG